MLYALDFPEVKKLKEELQKTREGWADQLMEEEKILTETVAEQLREGFKRLTTENPRQEEIIVDLLLEIENMNRDSVADALLADYANSITPVKTEA